MAIGSKGGHSFPAKMDFQTHGLQFHGGIEKECQQHCSRHTPMPIFHYSADSWMVHQNAECSCKWSLSTGVGNLIWVISTPLLYALKIVCYFTKIEWFYLLRHLRRRRSYSCPSPRGSMWSFWCIQYMGKSFSWFFFFCQSKDGLCEILWRSVTSARLGRRTTNGQPVFYILYPFRTRFGKQCPWTSLMGLPCSNGCIV